jgi:hypothetical protein
VRPTLTAALLSVALPVAACSGAGSSTAAHHGPARSAPTTTSTTTTAPAAVPAANQPCGGTVAVPDAVRASPVAGLDLTPTQYQVVNVSLAQSDPTWARFDTLPAAGREGSYKGGFGLAHCAQTAWGVTDFGTTEVGCPGGTVAPPPAVVRADLGIDCP